MWTHGSHLRVSTRFTHIGTIIGDKAYSVIYYSPAQTYPDYRPTYSQMIGSFEVIPPPNQQGNQTQPPPIPAPNPNPSITKPNPPTTTNPSADWLLLVMFIMCYGIQIVLVHILMLFGSSIRFKKYLVPQTLLGF